MFELNKNNSKIIWKDYNGRKKLFTIIPKSENQKNQDRNWNPFYSKLAAALFNGLEIFPFKPDSKIFYSDNSSNTTLNHLLDIIDSKGTIYLQKNNGTKIKNLKNVVIIDQGKNNTLHNHDQKETFDVIYLDITNNEKLQTQILNHEMVLKKSGFLIIILNSILKSNDPYFRNQINDSKQSVAKWWDSKSVDQKLEIFQHMGIALLKEELKMIESYKFVKLPQVWQDNISRNSVSKSNDPYFRNQINNIITNSSSSLQFIQEINLSGFFKNSMMAILQKTD